MRHTVTAGWTMMLADLALILFFVTATHATRDVGAEADSAIPQAFYKPMPNGPELEDWIAELHPPENAILQISVGYASDDIVTAAQRATTLAQKAMNAGVRPRVVLVEGGNQSGVVMMYGLGTDEERRESGTGLAGQN